MAGREWCSLIYELSQFRVFGKFWYYLWWRNKYKFRRPYLCKCKYVYEGKYKNKKYKNKIRTFAYVSIRISTHARTHVRTIDKHLTQAVLFPDIVRILSCVNIASSLLVIVILAPLSNAICRIVLPPLPRNRNMSEEKLNKDVKI